MFLKCVLNIYDLYFYENPFLFKVACLIDLIESLGKKKQQSSYFRYMLVLAVHIN